MGQAVNRSCRPGSGLAPVIVLSRIERAEGGLSRSGESPERVRNARDADLAAISLSCCAFAR